MVKVNCPVKGRRTKAVEDPTLSSLTIPDATMTSSSSSTKDEELLAMTMKLKEMEENYKRALLENQTLNDERAQVCYLAQEINPLAYVHFYLGQDTCFC